jgi:hypothetical protein
VRCVRNLEVEQRSVKTFYCKLGKSATEGFEDLKRVYGDECLSRAHVFEWFAKFHDCRESIKDSPDRDGRFPFELKKTSRKSGVLWAKTEESQPVWLLTCGILIRKRLATLNEII